MAPLIEYLPMGAGILIPWVGVAIPSNASSTTLNVNFDMDNNIEQYGTDENAVYILINFGSVTVLPQI